MYIVHTDCKDAVKKNREIEEVITKIVCCYILFKRKRSPNQEKSRFIYSVDGKKI
jgi:hypothetical protein